MKKLGLILLLFVSAFINAQSLKEALYGGKLKNDSGSVVRKSDDLKSKIDTTKKKIVEPEKPKVTVALKDSSTKNDVVTDSAKVVNEKTELKDVAPAPARTNTQIWKAYMDTAVAVLKREVFPEKKIKSGTYYVLIEYDIREDGQVVINNATPDPMDRFLQEQIRQTLEASAPRMAPTLSNGKPKLVSKKYNLMVTKD